MAYQPEPIFKVSQVLVVQGATCEIQDIEYRDNANWYALHNRYNCYGSGWINEDDLIEKLDKVID